VLACFGLLPVAQAVVPAPDGAYPEGNPAIGQAGGGNEETIAKPEIPADIKAIFNKPLYKNAIWGLRVVDLGTGEVLTDLNPDRPFYIGSVRKLFSVAELLYRSGCRTSLCY